MKLRNLTLGLMLTAAISSWAIPARRDFHTVEQPDGSTLTIRTIGDEHFHLTTTADGVPVVKEGDRYVFATLNTDGSLTATNILAADAGKRNELQQLAAVVADRATISSAADARIAKRQSARRSPARIAQSGKGKFTTEFPSKGDVKVLVILVEYQDVKFVTPSPSQYFTNLLNKPGFSEYSATGSAYDYFTSQSNGEFRPKFDVYGPIKLSQKRSYYGGNDAWGNDKNPEAMIIEAIQSLDKSVDFTQYDNDHNGTVDNVYVFYAGEGENASKVTEAVWPHNYELSSGDEDLSFEVDGVLVDKYACSNEWDSASKPSKPDGIGTIVHEFSHVMGIPDLYATRNVSDPNYTPQTWSVMDYGSYNNDSRTPPCYTIYERNALNWIEPEIIDGPMNCTLEHTGTSNRGYIIPTENENEFFLIENRQQEGWDKYIPGHGLLIWHIDFDQRVFDSNVVNNNISHQYVRIVKANNTEIASYYNPLYGQTLFSEEKASGWCWPGTSNNTSFGPETTPAMKSWDGNKINLPITDITEKDGVVTFLVDGGVQSIGAPADLVATNVSTSSFDLSWSSVPDADDYQVDITASSSHSGQDVICDMGDGSTCIIPEGWETDKTAQYTTTGNYGLAAPSMKFSSTGSYLTTQEFPNDIKSISFWIKGQQVDSSILELQRRNGSSWETVQRITPSNTAETMTITTLPEGTRQLRFYYTKKQGNVALDDIRIKSDDTAPLAGYTALRTGGETTLHVSPLAEGKQFYQVSVKAVKDNELSRAATLSINTINTGICITKTDDNTVIAVNGNTLVIDGTNPVSVYDIAGRRVAFAADGKGEFALPAGVYIAAGKKIVIR